MLTTTGKMIENKTEKTYNLDDSVLIDITKIKGNILNIILLQPGLHFYLLDSLIYLMQRSIRGAECAKVHMCKSEGSLEGTSSPLPACEYRGLNSRSQP